MTRPPRNLSASVSQRLLNLTRQSGEDYQYVLMRYGLERMMFRFSQSDHARQFVVKGAMLLRVWTSKQYRPTKGLDYPRETSIAEKFEAMVNLGLTNSRMKDYYDIWLLSEQFSFDGETLKAAIIATFKRRRLLYRGGRLLVCQTSCVRRR